MKNESYIKQILEDYKAGRIEIKEAIISLNNIVDEEIFELRNQKEY